MLSYRPELGTLAVPQQEVCLRQSQLIANIGASLLPLTISHQCRVHYLEPDDPRFRVETVGGDLVAAEDFCISTDPPWKVNLLVEYICRGSGGLVSPASHHIKVSKCNMSFF